MAERLSYKVEVEVSRRFFERNPWTVMNCPNPDCRAEIKGVMVSIGTLVQCNTCKAWITYEFTEREG